MSDPASSAPPRGIPEDTIHGPIETLPETPSDNPAHWTQWEADHLIDSVMMDPYQYNWWTPWGQEGKEKACKRLSGFIAFFGLAPHPVRAMEKLESAVSRGLGRIGVSQARIAPIIRDIKGAVQDRNFVGAVMLSIKAMVEVRTDALADIEHLADHGYTRVPITCAPSPLQLGAGVTSFHRPDRTPVKTGDAEPRRLTPRRKCPDSPCSAPPPKVAAQKPTPSLDPTEEDFEEEDLQAAEDIVWSRYQAKMRKLTGNGHEIDVELDVFSVDPSDDATDECDD